jgi:tRNA pseudouridine38-40 synthase
MHNYRLTIQYNGTNYSGWQSQPNGNTIQDELTNAISTISQREINLIGSGRTDAGVHAWGQIANFKIDKTLDIFRFQHALNSILPKEIAIKKMKEVNENFHSRFDAKKRSYIYLISKYKSPFYHYFSYQYFDYKKLKLNKLNQLSKIIIGKYNFTSFCKKKTDTENKICTVNDAHWKENKDFFIFKIEADRFLHGMVRTIVGTILSATVKEKSTDYIKEIIEQKKREAAGEAAPAKGLFLFKIKY